jgi:multiple sugar transport system ATP-binding protein
MAAIGIDRVSKTFPNGFRAVEDTSLEIANGEFVVLVGPSGSGKTTLLRMIAGLEAVTSGRIAIGSRDVTALAPEDRDIAMVFQNYALYPNMTVRDNLGFGLRMRGTPKPEIRRRVDEVSGTLELDGLLDRKPGQLSGGQRQRVAMGRAIVREPQVFLMDEPLSNLDAQLRVHMRAELATLHHRLGVTTVYVTHDQIEATTLGHRVVVLKDGVVQQCDTPRRLYDQPANLFVASFIGSPPMNLVECELTDGAARFGEHAIPLSERTRAQLPHRVVLGFRPTDVRLAEDDGGVSARVQIEAEVVEDLGADLLVMFSVDVALARGAAAGETADAKDGADHLLVRDGRTRLAARVSARDDIRRGQRLSLLVDEQHLHFFNPDSGHALTVATDGVAGTAGAVRPADATLAT